MRYTIVIALLLFGTDTFAANPPLPWNLQICWTNASLNEDGSALTDLDQVRIEYFRNNDTVPSFVLAVPADAEGSRQCYLFENSIEQIGTYHIFGYSINTAGLESQPSSELTVKMIPPNAPDNLGNIP